MHQIILHLDSVQLCRTWVVSPQLRYLSTRVPYRARRRPTVLALSWALSRERVAETSTTLPSDALCALSFGDAPDECARRTLSHSCAALAHRSLPSHPWWPNP